MSAPIYCPLQPIEHGVAHSLFMVQCFLGRMILWIFLKFDVMLGADSDVESQTSDQQ